jgi:hypothetical protein
MGPGKDGAPGTTGASSPPVKTLLAVGGSTTDAGRTRRATPVMVALYMDVLLWLRDAQRAMNAGNARRILVRKSCASDVYIKGYKR